MHWSPWYPQWADIDIRAELTRHWQNHGGAPANAEHRLLAYQLHLSLDAMVYTAHTGRWDDLRRHARQVAALLKSS